MLPLELPPHALSSFSWWPTSVSTIGGFNDAVGLGDLFIPSEVNNGCDIDTVVKVTGVTVTVTGVVGTVTPLKPADDKVGDNTACARAAVPLLFDVIDVTVDWCPSSSCIGDNTTLRKQKNF